MDRAAVEDEGRAAASRHAELEDLAHPRIAPERALDLGRLGDQAFHLRAALRLERSGAAGRR